MPITEFKNISNLNIGLSANHDNCIIDENNEVFGVAVMEIKRGLIA